MSEDNRVSNRYIYPYAQGVKLDIRKKGLSVYRKYPSRLYGSIDAATQVARTDRDQILKGAGIPSAEKSSLHIAKRNGASDTFEGLHLPPGLSVQYVRGAPHYFVIRQESGNKKRFSIVTLGLHNAYTQAIKSLSAIR